MGEGLIRITPDFEKAKSMLKMVGTTIEMIKTVDAKRFSSNVTKEYYDIVRELISIVLLLDGYKTYGEGAHKKLVEYPAQNYKSFSEYEISLIDDLRVKRNKIAYDGFFVEKEYIESRIEEINIVVNKLNQIIMKKAK